MNMNLPAVVTPPYNYHGCSTQKTFREEILTPVNMQNCDRHNVRKHMDIKDGDKYITLDISLKSRSLDKIKISSSESKEYLVRSGKVFIASLCIKTIGRSKKNKKARYAITNVSMKDISKIIKGF